MVHPKMIPEDISIEFDIKTDVVTFTGLPKNLTPYDALILLQEVQDNLSVYFNERYGIGNAVKSTVYDAANGIITVPLRLQGENRLGANQILPQGIDALLRQDRPRVSYVPIGRTY